MPNAQYAIDIAAELTGVETLDELDDLTAGLLGAGKDAEFFQRAMADVSRELKAVKAANADAAAALAQGRAAYAELERGALQAAKAAERAGLKNAGVVPHELAAASASASAALDKQATELAQLERQATATATREKELTRVMGNLHVVNGHVNKTIAGQAESLEKLRSGLAIAGPVGQLGSNLLAPVQGFAKLSSEMGVSNAAMLTGAALAASFVTVIVALSAALVAAVAATAAWAIGLADTNRNARLAVEAQEALNGELVPLRATIAAVSKETGAHADELVGMANALREAKVTAADAPAALRAVALAEAALGKGHGVAEFNKQLKEGKKSAAALSAEFEGKFGPIVAKQMLGLSAQAATFKTRVGEVFGGLNIDPVLEGLRTLSDLFDVNTASGEALKFLFESLFQPLIDDGRSAAYVIEAFVLGFEIGLVKLYIAAKPAIKAIREFFGVRDDGLTDALSLAKQAGEVAVPVVLALVAAMTALAAVVGVAVVGALLLLAPMFLAVGAAVAALGAIVYGAVAAWRWFLGVGDTVIAYLGSFGTFLADVGTNMVKGLVGGILGAGPLVIDAIGGVVTSAIAGAKKLLGIASPSKVFAEIGVNTALGMAEGVEEAAPVAQSATAEMVSPRSALEAQPAIALPRLSASAGAVASGPAAAAQSAKPTFDFSGATFNFTGVKDAEHADELFSETLTRIIEGDALALGT